MVVNLDKIRFCGKEHNSYAIISDERNTVYGVGIVWIYPFPRGKAVCGRKDADFYWIDICESCYFRNGLEW